jgi:predicted ATP-dependent endonuclease of OLD family
MHIERIEISGFKGISSLEFEPGQLNLITGANNSGKTSLLEAVELAFDPTKVEKYGERVEDLVYESPEKEDFEEAEISVWYSEDGETKERSVTLRPLGAEQIQTSLVESLGSVSIAGWRNRVAVQEQTDYDGEPVPELKAAINSEVRRVLAEHLVDPDASFPEYSAVSINVDGSNYEYIGFADRHPNEVFEIARTATKSAIDSWMEGDNTGFDIEMNEIPTANGLIDAVSNNLPRILHNVRFLTPEPPVVEKIAFRADPVKLTQDDIDFDKENAAVRLSDIEDYLKEHGLVENLDTLSLDQMVYEEDGEKYQVPYEFTGDGFKTLLGLLWELSGDDDEILLLEEPENHMHPRYIHEFVYWLVGVVEDQDVQMFLTTHDIDFIRSFFDFVDAPRKQFLSENFRLLKMDQTMPEVYDYDDAEELSKELQIDLRGI